MRPADYTTLTPAALAGEFAAVADDAASVFGQYDPVQLNWQPDAASWSIAQCFEHLVKADHEMFEAMARALDPSVAPTIWQRLPLWPRLFGRLLITSQAPGGKRRYTAPANVRPSSSNIAPDIVERFIACQQVASAGVRDLSAEAGRRVMVSPFVSRITYSVLDGYRLVAAHQRRHFEQAMRVAAAHPARTSSATGAYI